MRYCKYRKGKEGLLKRQKRRQMMISIEWQKMNKEKRALMMLLIAEVKVKVD